MRARSRRRGPGPPRAGDPQRPRPHIETFVCAWEGHDVPALGVRHLRPEDAVVGVDASGGRFARCLRCDAWVFGDASSSSVEELPPLDHLPMPPRGKALRDSLVLKLIAVDRGIHAVVFAIVAVALFVLETRLGGLQKEAGRLLTNARHGLAGTGQNTGHFFLLRQLERLQHLKQHGVRVLMATAATYTVLEGVEAVGLWRGRRWAEYLTAIATAGLVPFELHELRARVTVPRIAALVINLAVLVYLVWAKHLFGLRGGAQADEQAPRAAEDIAPR